MLGPGPCRSCGKPTSLMVADAVLDHAWQYECSPCFRARAEKERWPGWELDLEDEGVHELLIENPLHSSVIRSLKEPN